MTALVEAVSFPAHQGGWDEIALVAGPLALIGGLLWLANRRVNDRLADQAEQDSSDDA